MMKKLSFFGAIVVVIMMMFSPLYACDDIILLPASPAIESHGGHKFPDVKRGGDDKVCTTAPVKPVECKPEPKPCPTPIPPAPEPCPTPVPPTPEPCPIPVPPAPEPCPTPVPPTPEPCPIPVPPAPEPCPTPVPPAPEPTPAPAPAPAPAPVPEEKQVSKHMVPFVDVMVRYHGDDYMFSVMPAKPLRDMHWAGKGKDLHKVVLFTDVKVSTEGMKTKGGDVLLQAGVNSFWGKRNLHKIYGGPGICITNTPKAQISVFANAEYLTRKTVDSPKQFGGMLNLVATF